MWIVQTDATGSPYEPLCGFAGFAAETSEARLPYRLYIPPDTPAQAGWPLLLYMHGMGSIGEDNAKPLELGGRFASAEFQRKHPCVVLAPQCPAHDRWVKGVDESLGADGGPYRHSPEPTVSMQLLTRLLETLLKELPIDRSRCYVGGPSMGGFATWDLLCRFPERFAGAFPICGGADLQYAARLSGLPLWIFHGAADPVVRVAFSREMVGALRASGGAPRYTEYPDTEHNAWDFALEDEQLFDWLFAQHRAEAVTDGPQKGSTCSG